MQERSMYEREIDLVALVKYLIKHINIMCVGIVIGAVLFLGLALVRQAGQDASSDSGKLTGFEKEMKAYEEDYAQAEMEIDNLEKSIEEQIAYNNNSILMKINPYDKKSVSGQFYIDTNYEIMPDKSYQNLDVTYSIVKAYQSLATTGELAKYINEKIEEPIKERYLNELITITNDGDATFTVTVVHTDIDSARQIYDLIMECMKECKADFEKKIGTYEITTLNESECASVDLELKETQVTNLDAINTLKQSLVEKEKSFDALVMPSQGLSLKLPVIGAFMGGFGVAAVLVVLFLIDTTLKTEEDVTQILQLSILGSIPVEEGRKKAVKIGKRNRKARYNQYKGQNK